METIRFDTFQGDYDPYGERRIEKLPKLELLTPMYTDYPDVNKEYNNHNPRKDCLDLDRDYTYNLPREDTYLKINSRQTDEYITRMSTLLKNEKNNKYILSSYAPNDSDRFYNETSVYKFNSDLLGRTLTQVAMGTMYDPRYTQSQTIAQFAAPILNGGNFQQPFGGYFDFSATKPEDLPEMALPVLEFMEDVQPHIVIGCDRGGRLFGLAMHATWRQTRDGLPFPTLDGKLHFARVSKSEDPDVLQEKVDEIVETSKRLGKQRGNELEDNEQLRVLFVDDWVIGGGTKRLAQQLMKKHGAQTYFAVMCGEGADIAGKRELNTSVSWHDRPEEIGVNYLSTIEQNPDGTVTQRQEVLAVRSVEAIRNRQRIQQAAQQLASVRVFAEVA